MNRDSWLALGLEALAEEGEPSIRIEAITLRAGKSRGSFYHHFGTQDEFIGSLLARWRDTEAAALAGSAPVSDMPEEATPALSRLTKAVDLALDRAIRQLAVTNEIARSILAEADADRIAFLRCLQADPGSDAAADYALVEYAVFIGVHIICPDAGTDRFDAISALTSDMIATHWNE